jgi:hypothetical protein
VKSVPAKAAAPAAKVAAAPAKVAAPAEPVDALSFWKEHFRVATKETPVTLFQTVAQLIKAKKFSDAEAALKGYLTFHGKESEPWMYVMLAECIVARKGPDTELKQTLSFAAFLAKRTRNPNDLVRVADMLVLRGFYGPVGDPGYETNIGELVDLAAEKVPANAIPPMMSINLATHDKDPKRMAEAVDRLLSLGWPGIDDQFRRDAKEQVKALADALRIENRSEEADALMIRLADSESRDVYMKLTWKGEADVDLLVAEPLGATAKFANPRTVFGGALIKNGYGNHPEEVYVCPRAFEGDYAIVVEKIVDWDPEKPVLEATLEVILHEGTAEEKRSTYKIDLAKPKPIVVHLDKGRRKNVLPLIVNPPPAIVEKPKDAAKALAKPAAKPAPRGAPFQ